MNILVNLDETEIKTSHINENSNNMYNTELGRSIATDEPSINRATLADVGRISIFFFFVFFVLGLFLISGIEFLQRLK